MTPLSDQANTATEEALFPAELLEGGEVVLLAIKPSGWFVLLASWPVLATAGLIAFGMFLFEEFFYAAGPQRAVLLVCVAAGCLRAIFACFQWVGRLYVLTNQRVMRICGVMRVDIFTCPLKQIGEVVLTATFLERPLRLGTLHFEPVGGGLEADWLCIARPEEVKGQIEQAIRRTR